MHKPDESPNDRPEWDDNDLRSLSYLIRDGIHKVLTEIRSPENHAKLRAELKTVEAILGPTFKVAIKTARDWYASIFLAAVVGKKPEYDDPPPSDQITLAEHHEDD